ncbi:hypothetical protein JOF48_002243 [Arthrobacter stackebrandtii]|uniref:Uncharacterized protein n=1 Tax=Arthrobacter stackebrandtii TaxID=272161 RepID=A0ABS4YXK7_9MICC|nr:hypothetical protein [Arthrobacter stackebrandtii]MBP2413444.1 hypothetical protein [Arthrobacter stackebrandtii]
MNVQPLKAISSAIARFLNCSVTGDLAPSTQTMWPTQLIQPLPPFADPVDGEELPMPGQPRHL